MRKISVLDSMRVLRIVGLCLSINPVLNSSLALAETASSGAQTAAAPAAQAGDAALASATSSATPSVAAPSVAADPKMLQWAGNLRHRFETVRNESPAAGKNETYDHMRLRLRLGAVAKPVENLKMEFRLATGAGGTSTNQSYGDSVKGFRNYDFKLDRAAFDYEIAESVHAVGGRIASPWVLVGENDMLFDADLNFDGTALMVKHVFDGFELGAAGGLFILEESKDTSVASSSDVRLNAIQFNAKVKTDALDVVATAAEYSYIGVPQHAAILTGDFGGNSNSGGFYTYGYRVTAFGLELQSKVMNLPLLAFYEMAQNAEGVDRTASIVGVKVGQLKGAGDFMVSWDYRDIQKDATLGILTDGDSFGGGTDGRSHRLTAGYGVNKSFSAWLAVISGEKGISAGATPAGRQRITVDALFKF